MNVTIERLPESQVLLDITTDDQEFERALNRAYRKVVQQVRLPGFRPGKAPRYIVEQLLGREALIEQASRDLMDPLYQQALDQEKINPVGEPSVEIYQPEPLAFKVTVEVYPAVDPGAYQEVRVEPRPVEVTDEQVDEALERVRTARSPWNEAPEGHAAEDGDRVTLDVAIREAGSEGEYREPLTDSVYVLGKDGLFPQLQEAIAGMTAGETKEVAIAFAEDDESVESGMRGKTMDYTLTLKKIEKQELLPLDDEFAKTVTDGRIETLSALRDDARKDLLRVARDQARSEVSNEIIQQISDRVTVELPKVMIAKQVDNELENFRNHLQQDHNQSLEDHLRLSDKTEEELREELEPEAIKRLRNSLTLREIATREGISVSAQDIEQEIDRLIGDAPNAAQLRNLYGGNYFRNALESEVFDRKLIDRLIEIATEGRGAFTPPAEDDATEEETTATNEPAETAARLEADETPDTTAPEPSATPDEPAPAERTTQD